MARRPTLRQTLDRLLDQYEAEIAAAFRESVDGIRSSVTLRVLIEALERGDIAAAIGALNLDRAAFSRLEDAIERAYAAGGTAMVGHMPTLRGAEGAAVVVHFNRRNPRAELWLRQHSSGLVTNIIADQRRAIRDTLTAAMSRGQNPRTTALDIVGRINRATGRRVGGIVGLTQGQAHAVDLARQELTSGESAALRNYLDRKLRDRRFDRTVMAAIRDGKPIPADVVSRMTGRYADRLLQLRGETIARTESLASLNAASREAFAQGLDKTNYAPNQVIRTWQTAADNRVRDSHRAMNGQKVKGLEEPFRSPSGARLMHPGDTSLGAGGEDVINCRCIVRYEIDYFGEG
ncbi:MAG: hypothetical protein LOX97_08210 [Sphingomonas sp.]|nr:hypothetical protein [Sphingomonas sp.]